MGGGEDPAASDVGAATVHLLVVLQRHLPLDLGLQTSRGSAPPTDQQRLSPAHKHNLHALTGLAGTPPTTRLRRPRSLTSSSLTTSMLGTPQDNLDSRKRLLATISGQTVAELSNCLTGVQLSSTGVLGGRGTVLTLFGRRVTKRGTCWRDVTPAWGRLVLAVQAVLLSVSQGVSVDTRAVLTAEGVFPATWQPQSP